MTRSRPHLLTLLSGISGSGPSRSKPEASWPSAIDNEAMPLSGCTRLSSNARFWRASSAVSPTTTRQPGRIWMVVGRTPSGRGGLQPFIEATPSHLLLLQQISSKIARIGCSHRRSARDRRIGLAEPMRTPDSPCLSGRDQASPNSLTENP
jgi:hypothetical protein